MISSHLRLQTPFAKHLPPGKPMSPTSPLFHADSQLNYVPAKVLNAFEDEEDAAFCAQAEAFLRTCDAHRIAVHSLVLDLVGDGHTTQDSSQVVSDANSSSADKNNGVVKCTVSSPAMNDEAGEEEEEEEVSGPQLENKADVGNYAKGAIRADNGVSAATEQRRSSHRKASTSSRKISSIKPTAEVSTNKKLDQGAREGKAETNRKSMRASLQRSISMAGALKGSRLRGDDGRLFLDDQSLVSSSVARGNLSLGSLFMKLTKQAILSGNKFHVALDFANRAVKYYETAAAHCNGGLDLATSLHVVAAINCSIGRHDEAVRALEQSLGVLDIEFGGKEHALAAFSAYMHLGDTLMMLGKRNEAFAAYHAGLEVQMVCLGDKDRQVGDTCRYLAEVHTQALQFNKAEILCQHALDICRAHGGTGSSEEAMDRMLMGLICNEMGKHEVALENLLLASKAFASNGDKTEAAAVDASIGDTYVFLGYLDLAEAAYQKALTVFKGIGAGARFHMASVHVSLAGLYLRAGKVSESKSCCESALRVYSRHGGGHQAEEVASALMEIAIIYEALDEHRQAVSFLKKAINILETIPGRKNLVAGLEAQVGVLYYLHGNYEEAHSFLAKSLLKLRETTETNSSLLAMVLNQMGLCYVQLSDVQVAVTLFEESRDILEMICGPHHPDTLAVYSNLAGAYDALGRLDEAIALLNYSLDVRKEITERDCIEMEDEKTRLMELLRDVNEQRAKAFRRTLKTHPSITRRPVSAANSAL